MKLIQEFLQQNESVKLKLKILIELIYDENVIDRWAKKRNRINLVDKELSHQRYEQYKILLPKVFDKYYRVMTQIMKDDLNSTIKYVGLYSIAMKNRRPEGNVGTNMNRKGNKTWIALGIEEPHYALVYLFHELFHTYFTPPQNWNDHQYELNHMLIEFFTDFKLFHKFQTKINIFNDDNKMQLFRILQKEYKESGLNAIKFRDQTVINYKNYIEYIEKSKRWR